MKPIVVFATLLLASLPCLAAPKQLRDSGIHGKVEVDFSQKPELTMNLIEQIISTEKAWSVDEFLRSPRLPQKHLTNYLLVYESRSTQQATPENPRVISWGRDARTIFSFNGDPKLSGFNKLEIIEFNEAEKKFNFHEVIFDANNSKAPHIIRNSKSCAGCHHGSRLIFDEYGSWKGFYGSNRDNVFARDASSTEELDSYLKFKLKLDNKNRSRYGALKPLENNSDLKNISGNSTPNATATQHFNNLFSIFLGGKIKADPLLHKHKFNLLMAFCNEKSALEDYLAALDHSELRDEWERRMSNSALFQKNYDNERAQKTFPKVADASGKPWSRYLNGQIPFVLNILNQTSTGWSLPFDRNVYSYDTGDHQGQILYFRNIAESVLTDTEFNEVFGLSAQEAKALPTWNKLVQSPSHCSVIVNKAISEL